MHAAVTDSYEGCYPPFDAFSRPCGAVVFLNKAWPVPGLSFLPAAFAGALQAGYQRQDQE
jgi:hypothetical protein